MKKLLLILTCSIFCLLSASAQTQPCAVSTCIANPIITPNNFNFCPIDTLCIDSGMIITCPKTSPNSVLTISICENSTFTYSTPLNSGSNYIWTVSGDISHTVNNNEITISWGTQGMGVISVEETDLQGCIGNYTLQIEILATPSANYSITPTTGPYCTNTGIQFKATNTNPNSGPPIYYYWDFGDGSFSNDQDPIHPGYNTPGTYNCTLVVYNECQCADTITFSVNIITGTAPEITSCINTICEGDIVEYCTNASLPSWTIEGGSIINSLNTDPCIQVDWDNTNGTINNGYGNIYLSDLASTACQSFQAFEVPIVPLNPEINGADIVCKGDKTYYSFHCIPGVEYYWDVTGGFIVNNYFQGSYPTNISGVCEIAVEWDNNYYTTSGTVSLTLSSSILDCSPIYASKQISILNRINIGGDDEVCFNTNHTYVVATNPNNEQLVWEITNGVDLLSQTTTATASQVTVQWNQNTGVGIVTATPVNSGVWCEPIATFVVDISENPLPPSLIVGETTVCPNGSYLYTIDPSNAISPDNLTYQWTITGGTPATTTGNSANITWAATGPYSITIKNIMNDSPGCESAATTLTVNPEPTISPVLTASNLTPCINSTTNFTVTDNGNTIPVDAEITWTVSDPSTPGTSIYGSVVSGQGTNFMEIEWGNLFNPIGQAITVEVEIKKCNISYTQTIQINLSNPNVSFTFNQQNGCPGELITFSATVSNPSLTGSYSWHFDDGAIGSGQNTSHTYTFGGLFYPAVTFTDNNSGCVATGIQIIQITQGPDGNLSFDKPDNNNVIAFCPPNNIDVNITLTTIGNVNNVTWTDPNGNVLQTGDPTNISSLYTYHAFCTGPVYSCMGVYTVTLLDAFNCSKVLTFELDTACSTGICRVCVPMQISSLSCNPLNGKFNVQIFSPQYSPYSTTSPPTALDWSFGDGTSANNVADPIHEYSSAGQFFISSYDAGFLGACSHKVGCPTSVIIPFVVDWYSDDFCDNSNNNQLTHWFYENSSYYAGSGPFTIVWDYGDGSTFTTTTTTGQSQTHVYSIPGTYTVILTITAATGEVCSLTKTITVIDLSQPITATPNPICEGVPTIFFNANLTNTTFTEWNFGDGSSSGLVSARRTYTVAGTYSPTLSVVYSNGCFASSSTSITVNPTPQIQATSPPNYCTGTSPADLTVFATATTGNTISWSGNGVVQTGSTWFFDPDIAGEGTHQICAIETNQFGCFDDTCFNISVFCAEQPKIFGESQFCQDSDNSLNLSTQAGFSNYQWKKNNTIISNASSSTYIDYGFIAYAVGTYTYEVTFTDNNGCISASDPFDVVRNPLPNSFSINPSSTLCAGIQVTLTHSGTQSNVDYIWNTIPAQTSQSVTILPEYNLLYMVVAINEYGCISSSNAVEVAEEILVCNILSGCYCDTTLLNANGEIEVSGLSNYSSYSTYEWILTLPNSTIGLSTNQDLVIGTNDPNYQDIFDGPITLSIVDAFGCTAVSDPLLIEQCSSCSLILAIYQGDCVTDSATGIITGGLSVVVTGGSGNYIFDWGSFGITTTDTNYMTGMPDGWYCVTVTDSIDSTCTATICDSVACSSCDIEINNIDVVCDSCCYFKYELATGENASNLQWHLSELIPPPLGVSIILEQYPPGTFANFTTYIDSFLVCSKNELQVTISNFGLSLSGVTFKGWLCDELVVNLDTTTNTQYIEMIPASNLNAHLEANVSGGNGSYTYSWTGPNGFTASTQEIIGVGDGEYCVVVSDGTGTLCGDINSDGSINTLDITAITNMIMNGQYSIEADVNCDGNVNIIDLTLINNFISTGNPLNCCIDTTCIDTFCVTVSCSSCPIECQADSALNISTGYDNANQTLYPTTNAPGFISTDPNWILVASPDPNVNLNGPANVIAPMLMGLLLKYLEGTLLIHPIPSEIVFVCVKEIL